MKKISRRSFLALSGSAALLMAVNPLMANAAITEPELKSYYVAPFGESGTIQLDNSEHTYDFYDAGTYLDCSVGCYFGVVGASEPIWWSATTQVTIPNL